MRYKPTALDKAVFKFVKKHRTLAMSVVVFGVLSLFGTIAVFTIAVLGWLFGQPVNTESTFKAWVAIFWVALCGGLLYGFFDWFGRRDKNPY